MDVRFVRSEEIFVPLKTLLYIFLNYLTLKTYLHISALLKERGKLIIAKSKLPENRKVFTNLSSIQIFG